MSQQPKTNTNVEHFSILGQSSKYSWTSQAWNFWVHSSPACAIFKKVVKEQRFYYQIKPVHAFLSWRAFDEATDVAELKIVV